MTTLQRIEAYKFVLKQFEDGTNRYDFICGNLILYANVKYPSNDNYMNVKFWPELKRQMPTNRTIKKEDTWWDSDDVESRKTALRNSIDLAYYELVVKAVNALGLP